jgi:cell division protein FtsB
MTQETGQENVSLPDAPADEAPTERPPSQPARPPSAPARQPERRPAKRRNRQLSGVQIMFAAILAIGMVLGINFSSRIASSQPLRTYYAGMETEIAALQQEQQRLIDERDFAQSEAYVEQWARGEGKMVRPGEVLVIPRPIAPVVQATPTPLPLIVDVETTAPEPETWELWWSLLFDSPPPGR